MALKIIAVLMFLCHISIGIQLSSKVNEIVSHGAKQSGRSGPYFIANRDSYSDAAGSSYQMADSSYGAPMQMQGYGSGGQGWGQQGGGGNKKLSKKDILGYIGLLGLLGLKGLVPVIKMAAIRLTLLAPFLLPISIAIALLKPVFVLGRSLNNGGSSLFPFLEDAMSNATSPDGFLESSPFWMKDFLNESLEDNSTTINQVINLGAGLFGRELDNQCMERIACEGVFKSIPRIFLRVLGENYSPYKTIRKKRNSNETKSKEELPRRKDLPTLALKRLKHPHFLTKKSPITENPVEKDNACNKYKCTTLF